MTTPPEDVRLEPCPSDDEIARALKALMTDKAPWADTATPPATAAVSEPGAAAERLESGRTMTEWSRDTWKARAEAAEQVAREAREHWLRYAADIAQPAEKYKDAMDRTEYNARLTVADLLRRLARGEGGGENADGIHYRDRCLRHSHRRDDLGRDYRNSGEAKVTARISAARLWELAARFWEIFAYRDEIRGEEIRIALTQAAADAEARKWRPIAMEDEPAD